MYQTVANGIMVEVRDSNRGCGRCHTCGSRLKLVPYDLTGACDEVCEHCNTRPRYASHCGGQARHGDDRGESPCPVVPRMRWIAPKTAPETAPRRHDMQADERLTENAVGSVAEAEARSECEYPLPGARDEKAYEDAAAEAYYKAQDQDEAQQVPEENFEGFRINALTGEVIGPVGDAPKFYVQDEATLEAFLRMVGRGDDERRRINDRQDVAAARAVLTSPEVLEAQRVVANVAQMEARIQARRDGLLRWQEACVIDTVRRLLTERKSKAKSLQTPYGTVALTTKAPIIDVVDPDQALAFALIADEDRAVKVTTSLLKTGIKAAADELVHDWKAITLAVETMEEGDAKKAAEARQRKIQTMLADLGCAIKGTTTTVDIKP